MLVHSPLTFSNHSALYFALAIFSLLCFIARSRHFHRLILTGAAFLTLAAGEPNWSYPKPGSIVVMVDLSPSTRTATFRNTAALHHRIDQVVGHHPYQILGFSDHDAPLPDAATLVDMPCDQTTFHPPDADAIVLFSDGQFELPVTAPPTYPVIDPALDHTGDSAIEHLQFVDHHIRALIKNPDPARPLTWSGASPDSKLRTGFDPLKTIATPTTTSRITASLPPADPWPENDTLSITPLTGQKQKWWVGSPAPPGWLPMDLLPTSSNDYLQAAVIALNNQPADDFSSAQQQCLQQYVQELGGSLLIIGGNHAFAAGNYDGSVLEALSPLSSSPPLAAQTWLVLIDASGSMAGEPWEKELSVLKDLLPQLPPHDKIVFASFARSLSVWPTTYLPQNIFPTGPTNLGPALEQIADSTSPGSPTQLLLISDADTDLPDARQLSTQLNQKNIHLHLLAIGNGKALSALEQITGETHGSFIQQLDINQWPTSARQLLRSALPDRYQHTTLHPTPATPTQITAWNTTWQKPHTNLLQQSAEIPLVAQWQSGIGQVVAMAYPADTSVTNRYADRIAIWPQDPRFKITIDQSARLEISIDAVQANDYLNNEILTAEINGNSIFIPQTGPGQYRLSLPAPTEPEILSILHEHQLLNRFPIAGRYPVEFSAIGNNLENLQSLAAQTGGKIVPPGPATAIDFHWRAKLLGLSPLCAILGFALIALATTVERTSNRSFSGKIPLPGHTTQRE